MALAASLGVTAALVAAAGPARAAPPPSSSASVPFMAKLVARGFFRALVRGDVDTALPMCAKTMDFDGRKVSGRAKVRAALQDVARRARRRQIKIRWIRVLGSKQMRRLHGPPPARIARSAKPGRLFALARFDRLGAIAILARVGRFYRVVALTD